MDDLKGAVSKTFTTFVHVCSILFQFSIPFGKLLLARFSFTASTCLKFIFDKLSWLSMFLMFVCFSIFRSSARKQFFANLSPLWFWLSHSNVTSAPLQIITWRLLAAQMILEDVGCWIRSGDTFAATPVPQALDTTPLSSRLIRRRFVPVGVCAGVALYQSHQHSPRNRQKI